MRAWPRHAALASGSDSHCPASRAQRRVVRTGGSYLSQGDLALTFGLGKATAAEKVTVRWPDGTEQEFGPLDARAAPHVLDRR